MSVDSGAPALPDAGTSGASGAGPEPVEDSGAPPDPLPTCFDGLQNQGETDVDCGGASCSPCPTCSDGLQNQGETGVDCGGASCAPCLCTVGLPQVLGNPNRAGNDLWSPTLSSDGLTMYLSLSVPGFNERVAVATRSSLGGTFSVASALPSPVNSSSEGTPALSADGLSLYFYSQRFGGTGDRDLYVATRASTSDPFTGVRELTTLNSSQREDRPWVSPDELTIYFVSHRASLTDDLWHATRNSRSDSFGTPVAVTELNSSGNDSGLVLTSDGLVAFFASDRAGGVGGVDVYRAVRASTSSRFSTPERVPGLNSSGDDFDVELSADGSELFFASTRSSTDYRIWRSVVTCP
jgi:hypothetical protein